MSDDVKKLFSSSISALEIKSVWRRVTRTEDGPVTSGIETMIKTVKKEPNKTMIT